MKDLIFNNRRKHRVNVTIGVLGLCLEQQFKLFWCTILSDAALWWMPLKQILIWGKSLWGSGLGIHSCKEVSNMGISREKTGPQCNWSWDLSWAHGEFCNWGDPSDDLKLRQVEQAFVFLLQLVICFMPSYWHAKFLEGQKIGRGWEQLPINIATVHGQ